MNELLIYGSDDCLGWTDVKKLIDRIEAQYNDEISVEIRDPVENWREFKERGLTICPSFLLNGDLIAVGQLTLDEIKERIDQDHNGKST